MFVPKEMLTGSQHHRRLHQWLPAGICGKDITSSGLYVSAIAAVFAGVLTPFLLQCFQDEFCHLFPGEKHTSKNGAHSMIAKRGIG